jgi:hypothetical protein
MHTSKQFTGTLVGLDRRLSDENGNPRYHLTVETSAGVLWMGITQKSAGFVYGLSHKLLQKQVVVRYTGINTVTLLQEV